MNEFEKAIANVPYSTDWYEFRCNNLAVVGNFIGSADCKWVQVWETTETNIKFYCIVFFIYGMLYVWTDTVEDGKIESS